MTDNFSEIVGLLATGAKLRFRGDDELELVLPCPQPDGQTITRLMHHGWLTRMTNGGYVLSDKGLLAYMRGTDELQNVGLVDPTEYQQ